MKVYDVVADLRGQRFAALLTELGRHADTIGFVVQGEMAAETRELLDTIDSLKISDGLRQSWPGTRLLDGFARVLEYPASPSVLEALAHVADGVFDWSRPSFPEDVFMTSGATVLLETVGHERFAVVRCQDISPLLQSLVDDGILRPRRQRLT
ncbi:hypothetical protein [Ensifer soli]|uniref:hypothetical protein n=1 Tax=Ciceribacter sp. sgz301302 TaxID=3342379 RepID=UPI0035BB96AF